MHKRITYSTQIHLHYFLKVIAEKKKSRKVKGNMGANLTTNYNEPLMCHLRDDCGNNRFAIGVVAAGMGGQSVGISRFTETGVHRIDDGDYPTGFV